MQRSAAILIVFIFIVSACTNRSNDGNIPVDTIHTFSRADSLDLSDQRAGKPINNLPLLVDAENKTITPNKTGTAATLDSVIQALNAYYPQIKLEKLKLSNDTLYTIIRDSEFLGERMGTTGASEYYNNAIINLTSVPGIRYVKIDMEEHSHASPGVFSRKDFSEFKLLTQ